jgi:hypothetical protein
MHRYLPAIRIFLMSHPGHSRPPPSPRAGEARGTSAAWVRAGRCDANRTRARKINHFGDAISSRSSLNDDSGGPAPSRSSRNDDSGGPAPSRSSRNDVSGAPAPSRSSLDDDSGGPAPSRSSLDDDSGGPAPSRSSLNDDSGGPAPSRSSLNDDSGGPAPSRSSLTSSLQRQDDEAQCAVAQPASVRRRGRRMSRATRSVSTHVTRGMPARSPRAPPSPWRGSGAHAAPRLRRTGPPRAASTRPAGRRGPDGGRAASRWELETSWNDARYPRPARGRRHGCPGGWTGPAAKATWRARTGVLRIRQAIQSRR